MTSKSTNEPTSKSGNEFTNPRLRLAAQCTALIVTTVAAVVALFAVADYLFRDPDLFKTLLREHVRAIVGIPMAAGSTFCLVNVLEAFSGRIEFEALGLKFKGASGPIVLWVLSFLAFVLAIRVLW
jgi:hypothetical protein